MMNDTDIVRDYYDSDPEREWRRLDRHPFELRITMAMMEKYIKKGERVLDIGGGPGRYSLEWARRGCDVTLVDLSPENIRFAADMARLRGLKLKALAGDARDVRELVTGLYDHVFLMGPLYHLLDDGERLKAVSAALTMLRPGGKLYVSFLTLFSIGIYMMAQAPAEILSPAQKGQLECIELGLPFSGDGFTRVHSDTPESAEAFMGGLPLKKLRFFGQEGLVGPCANQILSAEPAVIDEWFRLSLELCERPEFFSYSCHLMFIGEKS